MHAYLAILRYDAAQITGGRTLRLWLALIAAAGLFFALVAGTENELASETLAVYLGWVLLPVSAVVIAVVTGGAINGAAAVARDSILSRAVTRDAYLAASATARLGAILVAYAVVVVPAASLIARYGVGDTSTVGILLGVIAVGALLTLVAATGLALSASIARVPLAVAGTLGVIVVLTAIAEALGLDWLSPARLVDTLAASLRGELGTWRGLQPTLAYLVISAALVGATMWHYRRKNLWR